MGVIFRSLSYEMIKMRNANLKFTLIADIETRAKRRQVLLICKEKGISKAYNEEELEK